MEKLLLFWILVLSPTSLAETFESLCAQLTDGGDIKSFYYRSTCYVSDLTGSNWDNAVCNHFKGLTGYLAILPGSTQLIRLFEAFDIDGHFTTNWIGWIGLRRNVTSSASAPQSSREYFYWEGKGQQWHAPEHATRWYDGHIREPDDSGVTCGHLSRNLASSTYIRTYGCTSWNQGRFCQYRNHAVQFEQLYLGMGGAANDTVDQHTVNQVMDCVSKCKRSVICQSFTFNAQNGLCAIHMLPAQELTRESVPHATIFDII